MGAEDGKTVSRSVRFQRRAPFEALCKTNTNLPRGLGEKMSDIRVFFVNGKCVTEIEEQSVGLEKSLQTLIEKNLETFVGVRWLASEYPTGKTGGRIDTLGVDENDCPVIIEYKRRSTRTSSIKGFFIWTGSSTIRPSSSRLWKTC